MGIMMKVVCILILLLPPITFGQVRISEVCPRNNTLIDTNGNTPDWIEIHNYSASPVNLLGWYLSDNDNAPQKWSFPDTTILANGYMLVFADGSNQIVNNELHANFKVNGDGEHLYLYQNDSLHQTTPSVCVPQNFSLVVEWNNSSVFWDSIPTPEALSVNHYPIPSDTLSWSLQSGFVQKNVPLFITSSLGLDVHFVQERKDVNYLDAIYSPSAFVWEKDNRLSEISTGDDWEFPEEVPLITTISARTFVETCPVSPLTIRTYVDMESDFTQENIVSLQINPTDFFGSKGIYVNGNYWNRGKNWERNAYLTYIENDSVLIESEVGTRITGSGSRANPQKSLRLYFREQFTENTSANYYFEDRDSTLSYKRLVLRATGSDFTGSLVRDALFTNLLKHSGIDYLSASPCIVFINGEYWGIHFIKEYSNPYLLGARHSIDPNEINIIENQGNTTEGSDYLWQEVASFLKNESLELPESYAWISERVDIENLCEYLVFQDLAANWDVTKNNVKIWYSNESDAKIRFIAFDGDATHYRLDYDLIDFLLNDDDSNILSLLFQKLWEKQIIPIEAQCYIRAYYRNASFG